MKIKMLNTVFYQGIKYPMGAVVDVVDSVGYAFGDSCEIIEVPRPVEPVAKPVVEVAQVEVKPKKRMYKRKNKMMTDISNK